MEHETETDGLECILCTGDLDTRQKFTKLGVRRSQHAPLTEDALISFSKLLGGVNQDPTAVPLSFTHSPHLRFCSKCTQKVRRVHETFTQIEALRVQLAILKDELEEELLRSYSKSTAGTWNRSTTLRHRIIRQLKLEPSLSISRASTSREREHTSTQQHMDTHDHDENSETYDNDSMDMDPLFIEPDCDTQTPENETFEYKPEPDIDQGAIQQNVEDTAYELKPCLIQLGSRIDGKNASIEAESPRSQRITNRNFVSTNKFRYPTGTASKFPSRCPHPGCTSTSVFSTVYKYRRHMSYHENQSSRSKLLPRGDTNEYPKRCDFPGCTTTTIFKHSSRYQRHMKVHTMSKVKIQSNPLFTIMEGLSYPAFCPMENCSSTTTYCDRKNMKKHISRAHLQLKRIALTVGELEAELDSCTYPTKCRIPGCENDLDMTTREELRCHLRASHHILRKMKHCSSALGKEISALTFPTNCPRPKCKTRTVYYSSETLRQHLRNVHERSGKSTESTEPDDKEHICPVCKMSFLSKFALSHHSRVHEAPIVNATCEDCGAGFRTSTGLKVHRETQHSLEPTPFLCTKCPKTFKTTQALQVHLQRHEGEKKYFCRICPKGFVFRLNLGEHERYAHWEELGLEQIKCHICSKVYSQIRTLKIHMSSHSGVHKFNCTECEYKTDYGKDYREHMATVHQPDFPFPCTECDKSFKLERRLRYHMLVHDEEAEACELCSKRFANKRTLRIHKERKHGAEPPDREYKEGVIAEFDV